MLAIDMAELDGMSPRERVFELIMRRLDAMAPYQGGPAQPRRARPPREPTLLARRLLQSRAGSAVACSTRPGPTAARSCTRMARRVTGAVYLQTFRVWLDDDTPDMARTLAELDRRLQQAESVARWFTRFCRFSPRTAKSQATA